MTTGTHTADKIAKINQELEGQSPQAILEWALKSFGDKISLACSLGAEDVALLDMMAKIQPGARAFVLDTGRLHEETYETLMMCRSRFDLKIETFFPQAPAVQNLLNAKGPFSFYDSIDNRKECCHARKVEPLGRALNGLDAWITGMRRAQSVTRADTPIVEIDAAHGDIIKVNPLAAWSEGELDAYNREHKVPLNPLHAKGFPSIGCAPCTRAIQAGEDVRAGRWWWESPDNKECGLHQAGAKPGT
ncbi:MAG: phosphoadenylyl-sulfate reductase [bacterium]|nr:phosphoadenylyl-sulfate reductase [bacterium]